MAAASSAPRYPCTCILPCSCRRCPHARTHGRTRDHLSALKLSPKIVARRYLREHMSRGLSSQAATACILRQPHRQLGKGQGHQLPARAPRTTPQSWYPATSKPMVHPLTWCSREHHATSKSPEPGRYHQSPHASVQPVQEHSSRELCTHDHEMHV